MTENILAEVKNLTLGYDGRAVVENVSFSLYRGETLCLVGPNGSGKSTLLKGMLSLIPQWKGSIEKAKDCTVSYLAQIHTVDREFPATVKEIVLSGTQKKKTSLFYTKKDRENAAHAMKLLHIESLSGSRIASLSGGQQQRVLLARALAAKPDLLILDEPCSALDPDITKELYALFDMLKKELGLTLLISTHDMDYVKEYADRVIRLGRSVEFTGSVKEWTEHILDQQPEGREQA